MQHWEPMTDMPPRLREMPDSDRAAIYRERAADECGRQNWDACANDLELASVLDPAGNQLPEVTAMRNLLNTYMSTKPR